MSSKPKANGVTTIHRIEAAVRLAGVVEVAFFHRAAAIAGLKGVTVDHAYADYQRFKANGLCADHGYTLPHWLLDFAEKIHDQECPRNYYKESWRQVEGGFRVAHA